MAMSKITSKHFTTLNLSPEFKGDVCVEPPFASGQTFSLINLPLASSRRRATTIREAVAHELVFRCLEAKKLALQDVLPMIQTLSDSGEWEPDLTHTALRTLRNPNEEQTWSQFFTSLVVDEDVWGRFYIELIRSRARLVVGMKALDVRGVREIGENGQVYAFDPFGYDWTIPYTKITGYEVTEGGQAPRTIRKEDVIAVRLYDIRSPLAGLSPAFVALDAVGLAGSLRQYVDTYLRAGGPTGVVKIKNKILSEEEAADISERFGKRYRLGSPEHGNPAVFDDDGDYQQIGGHLKDLDNSTLMEHEQAKICSALGVPGQIVEAFYAIRWGNQRAGQESAQAKFWENTLSPTLSRYRQIFDKFFLSQWEPQSVTGITKRTFWDVSNVKALQEDVDKVAARSRANYQGGIISLNEARTKQGFQPVAGGDQIQALVKEEAARVALEQQKLGRSTQSDQPTRGGAGNAKKQHSSTQLEFKGVHLSRQPNQYEAQNIVQIANAQESAIAGITTAIFASKDDLLQRALVALRDGQEPDGDFQLTEAHNDLLLREIEKAIVAGAQSLDAELPKAIKADTSDVNNAVKRFYDALVSALKSNLLARIHQAVALFKLRDLEQNELVNKVTEEMRSESLASYQQIGVGVALTAVSYGRKVEADSRGFRRVIYSAILDANVCEFCKAADGKESMTGDDLPPVPNVDCLGRWRCRCVWVYVFEEA